ncbi:MAG: GumC family protein [Desulfatibacillaceae bacterium]
MEESVDFVSLKGYVRRRKTSFLVTFVLIVVAAVAVAFTLPPVYLSKSTILIEDQQIPQEYVMTTVTSFVEERLQTITQRIMRRDRLWDIIQRYNLYQDMRESATVEEVMEKMREDIALETISADVIDRRTGRATSATIAFTLAYEGEDPATVQKVANNLASLYLEENMRTRERQASSTKDFLEQEMQALKVRIEDYQTRISQFKQDHIGELPEYNDVYMKTIERLEARLAQAETERRYIEERKIMLEASISEVEPLTPILTEQGETVMNPVERLKYLRLRLITLRGNYSEQHPDVKRVKKEIAQLEKENKSSGDAMVKIRHLQDLKGELGEKRGRLGPGHPDIQRLEREVAALEEDVGSLRAEKFTQEYGELRPDNPAYINLKTRIAATELELAALAAETDRIRGLIEEYQTKIENSPRLEKEYNNLLVDYQNARHKYNEIVQKLMEAGVAQGMEQSQRAERFTIIEPAQFPEKPYKPNRMAILLIGAVMALGGGMGVAIARESLDSSIKSPRELVEATGLPVLSSVDWLDARGDNNRRRMAAWAVVGAGGVGMAALLVATHIYVMPLDILWIKVKRVLFL